MSWWCKGSTLSRHVRGLGFDSRLRTLFSIDLCCVHLCSAHVQLIVVLRSRPRALSKPNLNRTSHASITPLIIHMCSLVCIYSMIMHEKT